MFSDFQLLLDKVHKDHKGLDKCKLRLERVPICTSILVTGLKSETSHDALHLYFENEKRSGGKDVSHVERKSKDKAIVSFEDPGSKKVNCNTRYFTGGGFRKFRKGRSPLDHPLNPPVLFNTKCLHISSVTTTVTILLP